MEERKTVKLSLSTVFLIIALIVIVVMAIFMHKLYNEKEEALSNTINTSNLIENNTTTNKGNTSNSIENNTTTNNGNTSFTEDQVETTLSNYLELMAQQDGQDILQVLTEKGKLNYKNSDDKISNAGAVTTNVKFSDYKKAMLNFVSETEFEKNWNSKWFSQNSDGYVTTVEGGGTVPIYTIKSINKTDESNYTAQTSYIIDENEPTPSYDKTFTFTITSYNGKCVIDSLNEI